MQMSLTIFFALTVLPFTDAYAEAGKISMAAEDFIEHGAHEAIKGCDLVASKCGASSLKIVDKGGGESNDVKRSWRTMKFNGLEVTAIFPMNSPRKYYLEKLVISGPSWPIPHGLVVGATRQLVVEKIGSPSSVNDDACSVYFSERQQGDVTICFANDRISEVTWGWSID